MDPEPHRRLLADVLAAGGGYPLVLAGVHAARALGLVERPCRSVRVATENPVRMAAVVTKVWGGLEERGWRVRVLETHPLAARLAVTGATGKVCEVGIVKEVLWRPPVRTGLGLALAPEDLLGTRVRDLAERGLARDLIDVHAASTHWSRPDLEEWGRRHSRDAFDLTDLHARLTASAWLDDGAFTPYGLDEPALTALRHWAHAWADDIAERLIESRPPED
ncbi:hypothetical protein ABZ896_02505 [Streptomyces sp. NPDC047072]|uniref:hypothetical protein n=1 Tax=Streptomyces sp. NPDC047072 TaxID=3154809 RepID=UPI0033F1072E